MALSKRSSGCGWSQTIRFPVVDASSPNTIADATAVEAVTLKVTRFLCCSGSLSLLFITLLQRFSLWLVCEQFVATFCDINQVTTSMVIKVIKRIEQPTLTDCQSDSSQSTFAHRNEKITGVKLGKGSKIYIPWKIVSHVSRVEPAAQPSSAAANATDQVGFFVWKLVSCAPTFPFCIINLPSTQIVYKFWSTIAERQNEASAKLWGCVWFVWLCSTVRSTNWL